MENNKCKNCEKKNECKKICPAAKITEASGIVAHGGWHNDTIVTVEKKTMNPQFELSL